MATTSPVAVPAPVRRTVARDTTPDPPVSALVALVARVAERRPELAGRADRAAALLASRTVVEAGPGRWLVQSQSNREGFYQVTFAATADGRLVTPSACTCPDAGRGDGACCKHQLAVWMLAQWRAESRLRAAVVPAPRPSAALRVSAADHAEMSALVASNGRRRA